VHDATVTINVNDAQWTHPCRRVHRTGTEQQTARRVAAQSDQPAEEGGRYRDLG